MAFNVSDVVRSLSDSSEEIITSALFSPHETSYTMNMSGNATHNATGDNTVAMHGFMIGLLLLNIVLHSTGISLLCCTLDRGKGFIQQLFIMNLSISELLKNIIKLFRYVAILLRQVYDVPIFVSTLIHYVRMGHIWGTYPLYFLSMIYLTGDRLLGTLLTITYKIYITETKAKYLLACTWVFIVSLALGMSLSYPPGDTTLPKLLPAYMYAVLHIIYVILAMCTYLLMFHKFVRARQRQATRRGKSGVPVSYKKQYSQAFHESRFFICIMIITSFVILSIIPGLFYIYLILNKINKKYPHTKLIVHVCYMVSDTADACIYIFLQRSIRNILMDKLFCRRAGGGNGNSLRYRERRGTETTTLSTSPSTRGETVEMLKTNQNGY